MTVFIKCGNPACLRRIKPSVAYCCAGCATCHTDHAEAGNLSDGDHPLISHAPTCDARHAERGDWRGC